MSATAIFQQHPYYSLLDEWERSFADQLLSMLDKTCRLTYCKTSNHSDVSLINMRFLCPLHFIVPRFLSLVEITKHRHFNEEKYFFVSDFIAIRLVLHKLSNPNVGNSLTVSLELYLLSQ